MKLYPPAKLGVMGSGQLGRMFAQRAIEKGYSVKVFSPDKNSPSSKVGASEIVSDYENLESLKEFLDSIQALTFEFENIPEKTLNFIEDYSKKNNLRVCPSVSALKIAQDRFKEKNFFKSIGLKVTDFYEVGETTDLNQLCSEIEFPFIMKTNRFGYDGKGQKKIHTKKELEEYLTDFRIKDHIIEKIIPFDKEISVIGARFDSGKMLIYPASENIHRNHILDYTIHPASIDSSLLEKAKLYTQILLEKLDYVGVLGLELFVKENELICNEFAPRPHNSGHYTMNASLYSQFDLQLFALTNIELEVDSIATKNSIMKNIIGFDAENYLHLLTKPDLFYHDYQKSEPKMGRKMGHWNYIGNNSKEEVFG
jgi:5-(carboxyamino)imidazole ribonucleotide synthase